MSKYKYAAKFSEAACCDDGEEIWLDCPICELKAARAEIAKLRDALYRIVRILLGSP